MKAAYSWTTPAFGRRTLCTVSHLEKGIHFPLSGTAEHKLQNFPFSTEVTKASFSVCLIQSNEYLGSDCSAEGPGPGAPGDSNQTEMATDKGTGLVQKAAQSTAWHGSSRGPYSTFTWMMTMVMMISRYGIKRKRISEDK